MPILSPILSQVTVWQNPDTGACSAEIGTSGARRKIVLDPNDLQSWGHIIKSELDAKSEWERKIKAKNQAAENYKKKREDERASAIAQERQAAQLWAKHHQNYDTTTQRHGEDFAIVKIGPRNRNSKRKLTMFDSIV